MENIGAQKMAEELKKLNNNIEDIYAEKNAEPAIIAIQCSDIASLNFPAGYYYNSDTHRLTSQNNVSDEYVLMDWLDYFILCIGSLA